MADEVPGISLHDDISVQIDDPAFNRCPEQTHLQYLGIFPTDVDLIADSCCDKTWIKLQYMKCMRPWQNSKHVAGLSKHVVPMNGASNLVNKKYPFGWWIERPPSPTIVNFNNN